MKKVLLKVLEVLLKIWVLVHDGTIIPIFFLISSLGFVIHLCARTSFKYFGKAFISELHFYGLMELEVLRWIMGKITWPDAVDRIDNAASFYHEDITRIISDFLANKEQEV